MDIEEIKAKIERKNEELAILFKALLALDEIKSRKQTEEFKQGLAERSLNEVSHSIFSDK